MLNFAWKCKIVWNSNALQLIILKSVFLETSDWNVMTLVKAVNFHSKIKISNCCESTHGFMIDWHLAYHAILSFLYRSGYGDRIFPIRNSTPKYFFGPLPLTRFLGKALRVKIKLPWKVSENSGIQNRFWNVASATHG